MEKFGKAVVKLRIPILILALILTIPAFLGMQATRINYDMLTYLPAEIDTVEGQNILMDEFGKCLSPRPVGSSVGRFALALRAEGRSTA